MSSPAPQSPSLSRPHNWRATLAKLATFCFRLCVILVALWSARFTIEREHALVTVEDYHPCAAAMGQRGLGFGFGCAYQDVSVSPSLLHQSYLITAADGASIRTPMAEPTAWNGGTGVERKTAATWFLYLIVAIAVGPSAWIALLRRVGLQPQQRPEVGLRVRFLAMTIGVCAGVVFFTPTLREILAVHRIESNEVNSPYTDVKAVATGIQTSVNGDLILLGTDDYDRAIRLAGYGCRLYTEAGNAIPRDAFARAPRVKLAALPGDTRFVGNCLLPQYDHAPGPA